MVSIW